MQKKQNNLILVLKLNYYTEISVIGYFLPAMIIILPLFCNTKLVARLRYVLNHKVFSQKPIREIVKNKVLYFAQDSAQGEIGTSIKDAKNRNLQIDLSLSDYD